MRKRFAYGMVCLVGTAALSLAGCSGDDGDNNDKKRPEVRESTVGPPNPIGPRYTGPSLPGLNDRPVWSEPGGGPGVTVVDLGRTVAVARPVVGADTSAPDRTRQQIRFHDVVYGRIVRTVDVLGKPEVQQTADGPVLVVQGKRESTDVIESYRPDGVRIGRSELPDREKKTVYGGQILQSDTSVPGWTTAPIDDTGDRTKFDCAAATCGPLLEEPPIPGVLFVQDGDIRVALDPLSGKKRWSADVLTRPSQSIEGAPEILGMADGSLVLAWPKQADGQWILSLHDLLTGEQQGVGPTGPAKPTLIVEDQASTKVVVAWGEQLGVWETDSGAHSLLQASPADPKVLITEVIYTGHGVAFDSRSGKALIDQLPLSATPVPISSTHVVLVTADAVHCFPWTASTPTGAAPLTPR